MFLPFTWRSGGQNKLRDRDGEYCESLAGRILPVREGRSWWQRSHRTMFRQACQPLPHLSSPVALAAPFVVPNAFRAFAQDCMVDALGDGKLSPLLHTGASFGVHRPFIDLKNRV